MLENIVFQYQFWHAHAAMIRSVVLSVLIWNPCVDRPAPPFMFPTEFPIDAIEMTCLSGKQFTVRRIDDPERIERFHSFIKRVDAGWKAPWKQCPPSKYSFEAKCDGIEIALFGISPEHITAVAPSFITATNDYHYGAGPQFRALSADEWSELILILEIDEDFVQFDSAVEEDEPEKDAVLAASLPRELSNATFWYVKQSFILLGGIASIYVVSFILCCAAIGVVEEPERLIPAINTAYFPLMLCIRLLLKNEAQP